ncbi:hypothetical protein POM88_053200 [Heracleum sosnowskyi]|uniref:Sieve element occlusion N-terminal domain-containing protein n=1 Tax=Heracleum sosnowskyi TaxID=360622 RepID=A0AAD8LXY1_9APIA|nr:hypothetical protein POM88_053200 [Heracleum sosnowskyi]
MTELSWELSTLAQRIKQIHEHLKRNLDICYQHIDEKMRAAPYDSLKHLFDVTHIDNIKVLRALIYPSDDIQPLVKGSSKRRVHLDVIRRMNVLLLISGLDISPDELSILEQIYSESRMHGTRMESLYELVWIPVMDLSHQHWTDPMQKRFDELTSTMPWYSVYHPSIIDQVVVRFMKERWNFINKPILVVLDPQGKELSPNALHMMWIWGTTAFTFTSSRKQALWRDETYFQED